MSPALIKKKVIIFHVDYAHKIKTYFLKTASYVFAPIETVCVETSAATVPSKALKSVIKRRLTVSQ